MINGMTLAGKQQHGFQKNKSTVTAGLSLQSLIAEVKDFSGGFNLLGNF